MERGAAAAYKTGWSVGGMKVEDNNNRAQLHSAARQQENRRERQDSVECIQICRPDLTPEVPVIPSDGLLQPPSLSDPLLPSSSPQVKRSYSMEHFRWGKPVGRKRRPNKLYTSNGMEEESAEDFPEEMSRREAEDKQQEKKDSTYKMKHFRWSGPPTSKRDSGFMKSRDEGRPLLALLKNGIVRDGQEQKMEQ
ncbi:hypothetical protein INR49_014699 [Caranx melampygus]|nr:hypothetical protein INR49_014699 [Caranx melampygus]